MIGRCAAAMAALRVPEVVINTSVPELYTLAAVLGANDTVAPPLIANPSLTGGGLKEKNLTSLIVKPPVALSVCPSYLTTAGPLISVMLIEGVMLKTVIPAYNTLLPSTLKPAVALPPPARNICPSCIILESLALVENTARLPLR